MVSMDFAVTREDHPAGTVLSVDGDLDIATVTVLRAHVDRVLEDTPERLLVDLSSTSFVDSTGCSELAKAAKRGAAAGVPVELVVPPANWRVRRVVDFMQFGELLRVHDAPPRP
jgi:anti-sigma B factor antagonist